MFVRHRSEGFKCALNDSLCANVNPTAGGHLPVHHQPFAFELMEVFPVGPRADKIGVGD